MGTPENYGDYDQAQHAGWPFGIAKEARFPVCNQTATHVGLGIVGGVVFDPELLSLETVQISLRLLRGERVQDLPLSESKATVPMVDWRHLRLVRYLGQPIPPIRPNYHIVEFGGEKLSKGCS